MKNNWIVYLLRCSDGSLYCGVTNDLQNRVRAHNTGKGAKYTRGRCPVSLVASKGGYSRKEAFQMEYRIKQLPKTKKVPFMEAL